MVLILEEKDRTNGLFNRTKRRLERFIHSLTQTLQNMKLLNRNRQNLRFKQSLKAMKMIVMLHALAFLQVSAKGLSQTVSFSGREVSLKKIFTIFL